MQYAATAVRLPHLLCYRSGPEHLNCYHIVSCIVEIQS